MDKIKWVRDNEDKQVTISFGPYMKYLLTEVQNDRGLNNNIVGLFSGFYATVARRKSTRIVVHLISTT